MKDWKVGDSIYCIVGKGKDAYVSDKYIVSKIIGNFLQFSFFDFFVDIDRNGHKMFRTKKEAKQYLIEYVNKL